MIIHACKFHFIVHSLKSSIIADYKFDLNVSHSLPKSNVGCSCSLRISCSFAYHAQDQTSAYAGMRGEWCRCPLPAIILKGNPPQVGGKLQFHASRPMP